MQGLLIQALALRQLGRLSTRKLLNPGPGPYWTEWCPRTLHTRQLCGSPSFVTLGGHKLPKRWNSAKSRLVLHHVRFKSSKKKGGAKVVQEEEGDDEKDLEDSDYDDEPEDDSSVPKDYKDIEKYVQSFRYDVIMKAGLDIARNKVEDAFYGNKLWLNGQKLVKKSKLVKVGDTLDLVLLENKETDTVTLLRVIIKKELGESKDGDRYKVVLRRWKNLELPKQNAFKQ